MFIKRIQDDEKEMNGTMCDPLRSLLLIEDGGGVLVTIKDIDYQWENLYEHSQVSDSDKTARKKYVFVLKQFSNWLRKSLEKNDQVSLHIISPQLV